MDTTLAEALAPVLRDLETSGSVVPEVQEWAVEELCSVGRPTNWPQCPYHRSSHPLSAVVGDGRAIWTCPATGRQVSEIGQLGRPQG